MLSARHLSRNIDQSFGNKQGKPQDCTYLVDLNKQHLQGLPGSHNAEWLTDRGSDSVPSFVSTKIDVETTSLY